MKAAIIAAGDGSRLKSEGITGPKPLVRVKGVALIERLLRSYQACGISSVHCIINEESGVVMDFVRGLGLSLEVDFTVKSTPSSMHSLFALSPHLTGGPFLLSTVDSIFDESDLKSFEFETFGNKALIFLRTYTILQFFPFWLWKLKDKFFNLFIKKPVHIICVYEKKDLLP